MLRRAVHDISGMRREHGRIHVAPTREQVRNSPDIDSHKPASRQQQMQLHDYFQWPFQSSDGVWEGAELAAELHKLMIETRGQQVTASPEQTKDDPLTQDELDRLAGINR